MVESAFNPKASSVKEVANDYAQSLYIEKRISIGPYQLMFNLNGELIYISQGDDRYQVNLTSKILSEVPLELFGKSLHAKIEQRILTVEVINEKLTITSTDTFDFTLFEVNQGTTPPFFTIDGNKANRINKKSLNKHYQNIALEHVEKTNVLFIHNKDSVEIQYDLTNRHHSLKLLNNRYLEIYAGNPASINTFERAKKNTNLFITKIVDFMLKNLVEISDSKLASVMIYLIMISLIIFPLEMFLLDQNNKLEQVKPHVLKVKKQRNTNSEQTKQIQKLYKLHGVRSVLASFAFSIRIFMMIFSIIVLINSDEIQGMSFLFVNDFHKVGDGWLLVWILPIIYFIELKLNGCYAFDSRVKQKIIFVLAYISLSIFLITPLIVLIIIYFSLIKLITLLIKKVNLNPKEKMHVADIG